MDPLSITTAVVGLLGALTTASIRINAFRKDFTEAKSEIDQMTGDLGDLSLVLRRLNEAGGVDQLFPPRLSDDLISVLERCMITATEAELLLERYSQKTLRGVAWAFSGKKQCVEICGRMEAQKATIGIALNMAAAVSSRDLQNQSDEILAEVRGIRLNLNGEEKGKNYILWRFLNEAEHYTSVAGSEKDASTITDMPQLKGFANNSDATRSFFETKILPMATVETEIMTSVKPTLSSVSRSGHGIELEASSNIAPTSSKMSQFISGFKYNKPKTLTDLWKSAAARNLKPRSHNLPDTIEKEENLLGCSPDGSQLVFRWKLYTPSVSVIVLNRSSSHHHRFRPNVNQYWEVHRAVLPVENHLVVWLFRTEPTDGKYEHKIMEWAFIPGKDDNLISDKHLGYVEGARFYDNLSDRGMNHLSPAGQILAYVEYNGGGTQALILQDVRSGSRRTAHVFKTDQEPRWIKFSNDGETLAVMIFKIYQEVTSQHQLLFIKTSSGASKSIGIQNFDIPLSRNHISPDFSNLAIGFAQEQPHELRREDTKLSSITTEHEPFDSNWGPTKFTWEENDQSTFLVKCLASTFEQVPDTISQIQGRLGDLQQFSTSGELLLHGSSPKWTVVDTRSGEKLTTLELPRIAKPSEERLLLQRGDSYGLFRTYDQNYEGRQIFFSKNGRRVITLDRQSKQPAVWVWEV